MVEQLLANKVAHGLRPAAVAVMSIQAIEFFERSFSIEIVGRSRMEPALARVRDGCDAIAMTFNVGAGAVGCAAVPGRGPA